MARNASFDKGLRRGQTAGGDRVIAQQPAPDEFPRAMGGNASAEENRLNGPVVPVEEAVRVERRQAIGKDEIRKARQILQRYKDGKKMLEDKIVRNEKWFKQRHWELIQTE